jgi:hypothetical protein
VKGRTAGFIVFLSICLALYALIHISVILTLKAFIPSSTVTVVVVTLWITSICALFIAKIHHNILTNLLYRIGVTWMGIVFLLFLVLFPSTMLAMAIRGHLSPVLLIPVGVLITIATFLAVATRIRYLDVAIAHLPKRLDGMRIVQLTDLHIGEIYGPAFLRGIVKRTNEQDPDIIVITGDVFDGGGRTYPHMVEPLRDLRARHGVYYVRGNHDVYEGVANTDRILENLDITILDDTIATVGDLTLIGLSYPTDLHDTKRETLKRLVTAARQAKRKRPIVLLRHEPKDPQLAADLGVDLMLSGHTHNGQLWPLNYLVGLAYPYRIGRHRIQQMTLFIGPGVGTWGPPLRLGSRSEITVFKLRHLD